MDTNINTNAMKLTDKASDKISNKSTNKVSITINGTVIKVPSDLTILQAASIAGFDIPTLCYLKGVNNDSNCRVCVVEVEGVKNLVTSCNALVKQGMKITTNSERVMQARKTTVELILSNHNKKCLSCDRNLNCELQALSQRLGCDEDKYRGETSFSDTVLDDDNGFIVRDKSKCILCRRCVAVCSKVQGIGVIEINGKGFNTQVTCTSNKPLSQVPCVACGQCVAVCPVGALSAKSDVERLREILADKEVHKIVGIAPAVRVALGESFGMKIGTNVQGKVVSALRLLGFDKVFDVSMTADLTIMEEGTELLDRLNNNGVLPMMTSCCPAWVRYVEYYYPELIPHLSSCKSPQQMFGSVMKSYYAKLIGVPTHKIRVITVMPCTAKKTEAARDNMNVNGEKDIDLVITTNQLAKMIKAAGIQFDKLKNSPLDNPIGVGSSAGLIFGVTGGVMEATLRTVTELATGKTLDNVEYAPVRGISGIKTTSVDIGNKALNVCVVNGVGQARQVMEQIKQGKCEYDFIEVMGCNGGCVKGGGQPHQMASVQNSIDLRTARASGLYAKDKVATIRKCHDNQIIKTLYKDYFEHPCSHIAHELLHTTYQKRDKY